MFRRDQVWARMGRSGDEPLRLSPKLRTGLVLRPGGDRQPQGDREAAELWRARVRQRREQRERGDG